jgi:hemoglobin/transferrin/lactoferrin receptor protein
MTKKIIITLMAVLAFNYINAQTEKDSTKEVALKEVVVSGSKFAERKKNIVQKIDIIKAKDLSQMNAQSVGDALLNTGEVFVQKSQQGGGSPVLRGFEASRIQLSIDGIRMNNAIYRAGHLQNSMTVDNNALDRIEVLSGPASTIHGSDALGGVILMKTRDAKFASSRKVELTGTNALIRYSTANQEKTANLGVNWGNNKFASYTNFTYSKFEDLMTGKNGVDSIMNLWKKKFIVEQINGMDSMVTNPEPYKMVSSGFSQIDVLQKLAYQYDSKTRHGINFQLSSSSDLPRYDRLSETSGGVAKNAEWYYGPQFRTLLAYTFDKTKMGWFFQEMNLNVNNQMIEESRNNRGYKKTTIAHRIENVNVTGYNFALRHKDDVNELTVGTDGQMNKLKSTAHKTDINTLVETPIDTRYPDGKNRMNLMGLFYQHVLKLADGKVVINDGLRFNMTKLHSTIKDTAIALRNFPNLDLKQKNSALTGNIGIAFMPSDALRFTANYSTGFRSPNFDDLTKIFESNNSQLIIPNTKLKPEYTNNVELGIAYAGDNFSLNSYGFYTNFKNAAVLGKTTYEGKDSVLYSGNLVPVYSMQNKAKAFLYGGGMNATYRPEIHFSIYGNVNYTFGRYNQDTILIPLDHIPPVTGRLGVKYETKIWYAEVYSQYNGKKKLYDYNLAGEDNLPYATPYGSPSWMTMNLRAGAMIVPNVQLQFGVENILDRNYRYFASGMSAPGRNIVLAIRFNHDYKNTKAGIFKLNDAN